MSIEKEIVIAVGIETGKAVLGVTNLINNFNTLNRVIGAAISPITEEIQGIKDLIGWYGKWSLQIQAVYGQMQGFVGGIIKTTAAFENFKAQMTTSLRSDAEAELWMRRIETFAAKTPFSVQQLTEAFSALSARGVAPSIQAMTKMGDFAAATGKPLELLYNAIGDATDPGRWLNFGIKMHTVGDKMVLTYRGIRQEVERTTAGALKAVEAFGGMPGIMGGMEKKSHTLGGAISNLGDAWDSLQNSLGKQMVPIFRFVIAKLEELLHWSQKNTGGLKDWVTWLMTWVNWVDQNRDTIQGLVKAYIFYKVMIATVISAIQILVLNLITLFIFKKAWLLLTTSGTGILGGLNVALRTVASGFFYLTDAIGVTTGAYYRQTVANEIATGATVKQTTAIGFKVGAQALDTSATDLNSASTNKNSIFKTTATWINRALGTTTNWLSGAILFASSSTNKDTVATGVNSAAKVRGNILTTIGTALYYAFAVAIAFATSAVRLLTVAFLANPLGIILIAVAAVTTAFWLWGNQMSESQQQTENFKNAMHKLNDEFNLSAEAIDDMLHNAERLDETINDISFDVFGKKMTIFRGLHVVTAEVWNRQNNEIKDQEQLTIAKNLELDRRKGVLELKQREFIEKYNGFSGVLTAKFDPITVKKDLAEYDSNKEELNSIEDERTAGIIYFEAKRKDARLMIQDDALLEKRKKGRAGHAGVIAHETYLLGEHDKAMLAEIKSTERLIADLHDLVHIRKQLLEFDAELIPLYTDYTELDKSVLLLDNKKKIRDVDEEIRHNNKIRENADKKDTADLDLEKEYAEKIYKASIKLEEMKKRQGEMHPPVSTKEHKVTDEQKQKFIDDVNKQALEIKLQRGEILGLNQQYDNRQLENNRAYQKLSLVTTKEYYENMRQNLINDGHQRNILIQKINLELFNSHKTLTKEIGELNNKAAITNLENTAFFANAGGLRINTDMALVRLHGKQRRQQISDDTDKEIAILINQTQVRKDAANAQYNDKAAAIDLENISEAEKNQKKEVADKERNENIEKNESDHQEHMKLIVKKSQLEMAADLETQRREEDDIRRKRIKASIDAVQTLSEGIFNILKANADAEIALVNKSIERQQARIDKIKEALKEGGDAARQYGAEQVAAEEDRLEKLKKLKEEEINRQQAYTEVQLFLNAALAISGVLASPLSTASAGILGIIQVGVILGTLFTSIAAAREGARGALAEKGGRPIDLYNQQRMLTGGMLTGPSHSNGGIALEAEGSEFIINKKMTAKYLPVLKEINAGKFSMIQHPKYNQEIMQTYTNNQNDYNFKRLENRLDEQNNILTAILKTSKSQKSKINIEVKNEKPYRPQ